MFQDATLAFVTVSFARSGVQLVAIARHLLVGRFVVVFFVLPPPVYQGKGEQVVGWRNAGSNIAVVNVVARYGELNGAQHLLNVTWLGPVSWLEAIIAHIPSSHGLAAVR